MLYFPLFATMDKDHDKVEDGDDEDDVDVKEREVEQDELQPSNICSAEQ